MMTFLLSLAVGGSVAYAIRAFHRRGPRYKAFGSRQARRAAARDAAWLALRGDQ